MHFAAASLTALEVMVAPATPSISALWLFIRASRSSSAAAWPMEAVSPETSSTTSVMASSLKVMVTSTVLMPVAVAE